MLMRRFYNLLHQSRHGGLDLARRQPEQWVTLSDVTEVD